MIDAVIRYRRRHAPYAPAFSRPDGDVSFARLDAEVTALATHLATRFGEGSRIARVAVGNPALSWIAAAAAQRIGWAAGFARSSDPSAGFGPAALTLTDATDAIDDERTVRLDPSLLIETNISEAAVSLGQASQEVLFERAGGGVMRLSGEAVEARIGEVDWLLPTGIRMGCLIGPETPFGLAVALRQWMKGGAICPPAPNAPLAGFGANRRLDLLVLRPPSLASFLEAMPPDAAPSPGLKVVIYGGHVPRALTLAVRLRLAPEVVLIHGGDAEGLVAMGVDTVARQDGEVGPLAPWLDAPEVTFAPDVRLNENGVVVVEGARAP